MLLTDTYYICSTDSNNDYKELYDFAEVCGFPKSDRYLSNGIPYYSIWSKKSRYLMLSKGVIIVDKKSLRTQLQRGKLRPPTLIQDFYHYKKYMAKWLKELILYHGLKRRLQFVHTSIGVIATDKRAEALFSSPIGASVLLEINDTFPNGRLSLVEDDKGSELEITEDIKALIIEKRRFKIK